MPTARISGAGRQRSVASREDSRWSFQLRRNYGRRWTQGGLSREGVWILSAVLAGGVGLSRLYLGVHFPTDVVVGWLLGAAAVAFYRSRRRRVEGWLAARGTGVHLALALLVPIALFAAYPVQGTASELGALAGVGTGLALTYRSVPFSAGGPLWQRALRFVLGGAVMFALYMGLRIVLPGEGSPGYLLLVLPPAAPRSHAARQVPSRGNRAGSRSRPGRSRPVTRG